MNYFTVTNYWDHDELRTAGGKGRDDYFEVLRRAGLTEILIPTLKRSRTTSPAQRLRLEAGLKRAWTDVLAHLGEGDTLVIHSPVSEKFIGYPSVLKKVRARGCRIIDIVFDLETFFKPDYSRFAGVKHAVDAGTEAAVFSIADVIICHNDKMKEKLASIGVPSEKIVCVGVMDYLRDDADSGQKGYSDSGQKGDAYSGQKGYAYSGQKCSTDTGQSGSVRISLDKPVVFCSNLDRNKSGFAYKLTELKEMAAPLRIDLYGPSYSGEVSDNIRYRGVYTSDVLMDIMEGSFGLVWDGSSVLTCEGACGEYLRYNNPHKLSHYLAGGMPVLIWEEAALADLVRREGCGMTIGSLDEIPELIAALSEDDYAAMRENARRVGRDMRRGIHIKCAVEKALHMAGALTGKSDEAVLDDKLEVRDDRQSDAATDDMQEPGREDQPGAAGSDDKAGKYDFLIVGAGIYGSVLARELTDRGFSVLVVERRDHIGGNAYTEDMDGIMVHVYGPHIFHTDNRRIWDYVNNFGSFREFINQPAAMYGDRLYPLPFNMHTFREIWGVTEPGEAEKIIRGQAQDYFGRRDTEDVAGQPYSSLQDRAVSMVGTEIYEKLIKGYTEKQWGRPCSELPASIIERLPVRFEYNNNYYNDRYQGIPEDGYTALIARMLGGIEVRIGVDYLDPVTRGSLDEMAEKVVFTGPIDEFYGSRLGALDYRGLRSENERLEGQEYFQDRAVVNYTEASVPWTRVIEHKHFQAGSDAAASGSTHTDSGDAVACSVQTRSDDAPAHSTQTDSGDAAAGTVQTGTVNGGFTIITREYPAAWKPGDEAFYPVRDEANIRRYESYLELAGRDDKVFFGGRLGSYRYYDMDDAVEAALSDAEMLAAGTGRSAVGTGGRIPGDGEHAPGTGDRLSGAGVHSARVSRQERRAIILFTREPEPGLTKTRLMPYFSPEQCAELHRSMIRDVAAAAAASGSDIFVAYTGGEPVFLRSLFGGSRIGDIDAAGGIAAAGFFPQEGGNIGGRMKAAIERVLDAGYDKAVLIGTDIPEITSDNIRPAFDALDGSDIILSPTADGGYYLIGMKKPHAEAFNVELYGVSSVYEETLAGIRSAGLTAARGTLLHDIDTPEDISGYRSRMRTDPELQHSNTGRFLAETNRISVIIPVYNEAALIDSMLDQMIPYADEIEVIFVDGGSTDGTEAKISSRLEAVRGSGKNGAESGNSSRLEAVRGFEKNGLKLIKSSKSRALQMNAGACAANGDTLFFLHCDSIVPDDFVSEIRRVMTKREWGCFGIRFCSKNFFMLTNRLISNHRAAVRDLPFGDQGMFIDRETFFREGMFPEIALMEDYEFAMRMKRRRIRPGFTERRILTSSRRYGKGMIGILRTEFDMWNLRRLYRKGISPDELAARYKDER